MVVGVRLVKEGGLTARGLRRWGFRRHASSSSWRRVGAALTIIFVGGGWSPPLLSWSTLLVVGVVDGANEAVELRKKLVGVITSASLVPRQQVSPPTRHVSHFHCHTSADRCHRRRPTIIPPTSTNDDDNQPTRTTDSGDDRRQPVGPTIKCFLFFLFLFRFTN